MDKLRRALCSLVLLVGMLAPAGTAIADDHCGAAFDACEQEADNAKQIRDCIDGYFACKG